MQMRLSARKVTWRFVVPHGLLTGCSQKNVGAAAHRYRLVFHGKRQRIVSRAATSIKSFRRMATDTIART